jgi:hypothetical protein
VGEALTLPQVFEAAAAALSRPVSGLAAGKLVVQLLVNLVVKLAAAASLSRPISGLVAGKLVVQLLVKLVVNLVVKLVARIHAPTRALLVTS